MKVATPKVVELRPNVPWMTKQEAEDWHTIAAFERAIRNPIRRAEIAQRRQQWRDQQMPAFLRKQAS